MFDRWTNYDPEAAKLRRWLSRWIPRRVLAPGSRWRNRFFRWGFDVPPLRPDFFVDTEWDRSLKEYYTGRVIWRRIRVCIIGRGGCSQWSAEELIGVPEDAECPGRASRRVRVVVRTDQSDLASRSVASALIRCTTKGGQRPTDFFTPLRTSWLLFYDGLFESALRFDGPVRSFRPLASVLPEIDDIDEAFAGSVQ